MSSKNHPSSKCLQFSSVPLLILVLLALVIVIDVLVTVGILSVFAMLLRKNGSYLLLRDNCVCRVLRRICYGKNLTRNQEKQVRPMSMSISVSTSSAYESKSNPPDLEGQKSLLSASWRPGQTMDGATLGQVRPYGHPREESDITNMREGSPSIWSLDAGNTSRASWDSSWAAVIQSFPAPPSKAVLPCDAGYEYEGERALNGASTPVTPATTIFPLTPDSGGTGSIKDEKLLKNLECTPHQSSYKPGSFIEYRISESRFVDAFSDFSWMLPCKDHPTFNSPRLPETAARVTPPGQATMAFGTYTEEDHSYSYF